ncbi:MAG: hypothetical protein IRY87_38755 [Acetobacteraceae bacterium]|nr:hypothetical protein [Acetobacteraceae bacterium]
MGLTGRFGGRRANPWPVRRARQQRSRPLAWHLAALCLTLILPVLTLAGVLAWSYATSERARLEQTALEAARVVAIAIDRDLAGLTAAADGGTDVLQIRTVHGWTTTQMATRYARPSQAQAKTAAAARHRGRRLEQDEYA